MKSIFLMKRILAPLTLISLLTLLMKTTLAQSQPLETVPPTSKEKHLLKKVLAIQN